MRRGRWAYCPTHYEELAALKAAAGEPARGLGTCKRKGCTDAATVRRGRWGYCERHNAELEALRSATAAAGPIPKREKIGPLEERARSLVKTAREADSAAFGVTVAKIKGDDAREKFRRQVRALAFSEGFGRE
jgi:hypothetical protein